MRVAIPLALTICFVAAFHWSAANGPLDALRFAALSGLVVAVVTAAAFRRATWRRLVARLNAPRSRRLVLAAVAASVAAAAASWLTGRFVPLRSGPPLVAAAVLLAAASPRPRRTLLATVWLIGASAMLLDLLCHALRSVPQLAQGPFAATARFLYRADRATLQFLPTAAQPDPQLGYVLRPSARFVFAETEFADEFTTNSAGLRDREADLATADVVALGDSHTLGWGVAQDATFAEVLERTLGRVVLNAGVSSYGTARALRLLERIPARATARVLVIQYSDNDHPENHAFVAAGAVQAMSAEVWQQLSTEAQQRSGYAPGKHVARLALSALDSLLEPFHRGSAWVPANPTDGADVATQARTFLDVLCASPVDLSRYRIVLLGLSEWNAAGDGFVDAVRAQLQTREYPPHLASMQLVPLAERLGPDVWYSLDDHLRAEGHARIAAALAAALAER